MTMQFKNKGKVKFHPREKFNHNKYFILIIRIPFSNYDYPLTVHGVDTWGRLGSGNILSQMFLQHWSGMLIKPC